MNDAALLGLPPDALDRITLEARKEGVFAGLTSGLASAIIGSRLFYFRRNVSLFTGALAGVLSGYLFTRAFRDSAISKLQAEFRSRELTYRNAEVNSEQRPPS